MHPAFSELTDASILKHTYWPVLLVLGAIIFFILLLILLGRGNITQNLLAYSSSACLLITLAGLVSITYFFPKPVRSKNTTLLTSHAQVDSLFHRQTVFAEHIHTQKPTRIPLGLLINSVAFTSSDTATVTGKIWVHGTDETKDFAGHFNFINAKAPPTLVKESDTTKNKITTSTWNFTVQIQQKIAFLLYPYDTPSIDLKIAYTDAHQHVLFTPALGDYDNTLPQNKPGLKPNLSITGYTATESFFAHDSSDNNRTLTFTMTLERDISYMLMLMLFAIATFFAAFFTVLFLLVNKKITELVAAIACILLVSATIAMQIFLRKTIQANGFLFIESFIFLLYTHDIVFIGYLALKPWFSKKIPTKKTSDFLHGYLLCFLPITLAAMIIVSWLVLF